MKPRIAVVYAPPAGLGGWGHVVATVLNALSEGGAEVHAVGPEPVGQWPLPGGIPAVRWHRPPIFFPDWRTRYTWLRWFQGRSVFQTHSRMGQWAAKRVACLRPDACYVFTEVGLETLNLTRRMGIPAILDSASGHIKGAFAKSIDVSLTAGAGLLTLVIQVSRRSNGSSRSIGSRRKSGFCPSGRNSRTPLVGWKQLR